jgi:hypothetical protein
MESVEVITYDDPNTLSKNPYFNEYREAVHICATESLRQGVIKRYHMDETTIMGPIIGIGLLTEGLLGAWTEPETKLLQYTQLSEITRDLIAKSTELGRKQLHAFRLNQADVLQTIRTLAEAGVLPRQLPITNNEEALFVEIWDAFESSNSSIKDLRRLFREQLETSSGMNRCLIKSINHLAAMGNEASSSPIFTDTLVLHGFHFITPIQYRLFSLMRNAGVKLVFLNLYDTRYKETFNAVESFIGQWADTDSWLVQSTDHSVQTWGDRFALTLEGHAQLDTGLSELSIVSYEDFYAFLNDYEENILNDVPVDYFSPRYDDVNSRLREYHPDHFEQRHFLSYPIGQFLFRIHKMWDEVSGELFVDERSLFECFNSGWLQTDGINSRAYTETLVKIFPYFSTCKTLQDWKNQMDHLRAAKMTAVSSFETSVDGETRNRFHETMSNPLLRFSFFSVSDSEMDIVHRLVNKLFDIGYTLFGNAEARVSLSGHFRKIEEMLRDSTLSDRQLYQEELSVLQELQGRLSYHRENETEFLVQDLADAISLYLGGEFNTIDELTPSQSSQGGKPGVKKFEDLDATAFFRDVEISVVGLDQNSLPYTGADLPWPLSRRCLEELQMHFLDLGMILLRQEKAPHIARYLLYSLLAFHPNVTLSWMRKWEDEDDLEESLYLMLLGIAPEQKSTIDHAMQSYDLSKTREPVDAVKRELSAYPPDAVAEYEICPRRFYYSFLAQEYSTFNDEFHFEFLFGNLLRTSLALTDCDVEDAYQQISSLFPHWTELKKQELKETSLLYISHVDKGYDIFEGVNYTRARKLFQFLVSGDGGSGGYSIRNVPDKNRFLTSLDNESNIQMTAKPSVMCRYCPHLSICGEGYFPVDDRQRGW